MYTLTQPAVTGANAAPAIIVDLSVLGVNRPRRSREQRIATHYTNDRSFVNQWLGESPVTWQMDGQFVTGGGAVGGIATGALATPAAAYQQLDDWGKDGTIVRVSQKTDGTAIPVGEARVRRLSETGRVFDRRLLVTNWSLTLLFEAGDADVGDGAPSTASGITPTDGGGDDGGTTDVPTTPDIPVAGSRLRISVTNSRALSQYDSRAFEVANLTAPAGTQLVINTLNTPAPSGATSWGYYLWVEQFDTAAGMWQPLDAAQPATRYTPDGTYSHTRLIGPAAAGYWWWLRVRQAYADSADSTPAANLYDSSSISNLLAVYWGTYGGDGTDIVTPVEVAPEPDTPTPPPVAAPHRARISLQFHDRANPPVIIPATAIRMGSISQHAVYRIPYDRVPRFTFTLVPEGAGPQPSNPEYSFQIETWDGTNWVAATGGYFLDSTGKRVTPDSGTVASSTALFQRWDGGTSGGWSPGSGDVGATTEVWIRGKFTYASDSSIIYTPAIGLVWPNHAGTDFTPEPPQYDWEPTDG